MERGYKKKLLVTGVSARFGLGLSHHYCLEQWGGGGRGGHTSPGRPWDLFSFIGGKEWSSLKEAHVLLWDVRVVGG